MDNNEQTEPKDGIPDGIYHGNDEIRLDNITTLEEREMADDNDPAPNPREDNDENNQSKSVVDNEVENKKLSEEDGKNAIILGFIILSPIVILILNQIPIRYLFWSFLGIFFLLSSVNWGVARNNENDWVKRLKTLPYPTLFLSIGILGTFYGIYEGLQELGQDTNKPTSTNEPINNKDIQELISSLTLAFTTSLAGMGLALIYRILEKLFGVPTHAEPGAQEIINAIKSIGGIDLENIAEENLKSDIQKFKESVQILNKWVKDNKDQMEATKIAYQEGVKGIKEIRNSIGKITEEVGKIPSYMQEIRNTISQLDEPLGRLANLENRAGNALMSINQIGDTLQEFNQLRRAIEEIHEKMLEVLDTLKDSRDEFKDHLSETAKKHIEEFAGVLGAISKKFATDYTPIADQLREALEQLDIDTDNTSDEEDSDA